MKLAHINVRPFVMVVPEFPQRTEFIQNHLRESGIAAEEFNCVSAALSGLKTVNPYEFDAPGQGWNVGPKAVALLVSFQMFWMAASFMPDDYFFFIEWDAKFLPDWKSRAEQAIKDTPPDFDFLFLGSCCCANKPTKHIKGEVFRVEFPMCNHAQIIAKKALPTLLRTQRKFYAPVDIALAFHSFPHLKVYTLLPRCVEQFDTKLGP
jgi:hypothetical protein